MISFIIPTLNEEKIIEKTLKCLSGYSGEKEIIVSDGHSQDKTIEIAKKYGKVAVHDGSFRQTIGEGRNEGVKIAEGDFLVFLDADIFIPKPDIFFKKALEIFAKKTNLLALTVKIKVFPEEATWSDKIIFGYMNLMHLVSNNYLNVAVSAGEFQMIRADAFKKIGGFNPELVAGEDYDMFRRLKKIGETYFIKDLVVYHTGRRAHAIGWPKLLFQWFMNNLHVVFFKKARSKVWEEIR